MRSNKKTATLWKLTTAAVIIIIITLMTKKITVAVITATATTKTKGAVKERRVSRKITEKREKQTMSKNKLSKK